MKLVINRCYGGFSLSRKAWEELKKLGHSGALAEEGPVDMGDNMYLFDVKRNDPYVLDVVRRLSEDADGHCAELKIIEIPDDIEYTIEEYDGLEWVAEKHRQWPTEGTEHAK